ncbi:MAG: DUF1326 domain-containing protein [Acidobacteriota bacterium]|nr:DUF1326 domain-containing protein [Acidobacteriota bacterium]
MKPSPMNIALVSLILVACTAQAGEPPWAVSGKVLATDNCVIGCPCIFGEQPSHNTCRFVAIFQAEGGHFGEVDLTGTRFAMAGEFTRANEQGEQKYLYVAYYVDSGAGTEQQKALRTILTGPAFAPLGEPGEVKALPISFEGLENFGLVGMTTGGTVGDIAKVEVTPIAGAKAGEPMIVENSAEPLWHWTALGKATSSYYRSGGRDYSFEGTSGESHKFAFSGGGEE